MTVIARNQIIITVDTVVVAANNYGIRIYLFYFLYTLRVLHAVCSKQVGSWMLDVQCECPACQDQGSYYAAAGMLPVQATTV